jgi:hypothetical protein
MILYAVGEVCGQHAEPVSREQHKKVSNHDLVRRRCGMWATCTAMSSIQKL